jgi:uncharacterized membrane protein YdjX (TVP38/TMEM64 family)
MARHQLQQRSTQLNTRHAAKTEDLPGATTSARLWLAALLAALGTLILVWLLSPGLRSDMGQVALFLSALDAAALRDWILSFGAFSPLVYFLVVVAQVIVSPIPAGPVTFAGAMIFGVPQGLALSMAGSVVGSVLVFAAARRRTTSTQTGSTEKAGGSSRSCSCP